MIIDYDSNYIPFISMKEGKGIKENTIYIRKGTSSIVANYGQLQTLLNSRIATNYNTSSEIKLEEHINQLKLLYSKINKYNYVYVKSNTEKKENIVTTMTEVISNVMTSINANRQAVENPNFPQEDLEKFIVRLISMKKKKIEKLLDV